MLNMSTAVRNARLNAIETAIGVDAILKLFGGAAKPANVATADAGTVLSTVTLPSNWMADAASGSKAKAGTWTDATADATGLARYYRIYASDGTTCHLQGPVSQAWTASTAYVLNQHVSNGGRVYICVTAGTSAGSGGPSGTSAGITDGSVSWDYVETAGMVVNNVSLAAGQEFTVNSYQWDEGNA